MSDGWTQVDVDDWNHKEKRKIKVTILSMLMPKEEKNENK